jgi:hypothetical protein
MKTIRLAIAALVAAGLAGAPFAAQAKKYKHVRHQSYSSSYSPEVPNSARYPTTAGVTVPVDSPHGSSGQSIGTVTAPSIGSYNWPSVGVTNAVPTWSNTNPR